MNNQKPNIYSNTTIKIPNYQITETVYSGSRTRVYRGIRTDDKLPVVIKVMKRQYPTFTELVQFRNQYTIAKNLEIPAIIQLYNLEPYQNGYALVMEDFGGISLQEFLQEKLLTLEQFFPIAIQLADILQQLHQHGVIHKDIKPANILIHPQTKQVKLIDFSIASLLPRETQEIQNPNVLEGTLAYISPEQTGRMNRGIDYRSDYYSLGVTFFEMLTNHLPFHSDDPMELVHCHIAKASLLVHEIDSEIPCVLSKIVNKLMAKNAEDRYQSAWGLKHDLETCLSELQETGKISDFEIGQQDVSDRFLIPDKLYGRETEVETLLEAFERVSNPPQTPLSKEIIPPQSPLGKETIPPQSPHPTKSAASSGFPLSKGDGRGIKQGGRAEMILVAGFSGIGKTAVVNEVHKPIVRQRGYFISGKFDQFQRSIPFSAFVQAFRNFIEQLLTESDAQIQQWKSKILEAVGENGQVIIEVIPELVKIIGEQPPLAELSGTAAQNRFNLLFLKFIQVFTAQEHPLAIFLDDLQWADSASLQLIKLLMSESNQGYLLLIGAYRDNEVSPAHPLVLILDELLKTKAKIQTIILQALSQFQLNQLVADTLNCEPNLALPLSELIYLKTQGNPFFATQFLKALYQDGLIKFNYSEGCWQCDISQINQQVLTDDVVEFMALQLQKLPKTTQDVLKLAACIGNKFDLETLAIISEKSEIETAACLWNALEEGLILPQSEIYKFYVGEVNQAFPHQKLGSVSYKFLHDRVQQAAYSLIPTDDRQALHFKIGKLLKNNTPAANLEKSILKIVSQLNVAVELITQFTDRQELAQFNLIASCKAKAATAYLAAMKYAKVGIDLLPENCWQNQYKLTLELHQVATETAYLAGDIEQMETLIHEVIKYAQTPYDRVSVYEVKISALTAQGQFSEAIAATLTILKQLGVELPATPSQEEVDSAFHTVSDAIADRLPQELLNLPEAKDANILAAARILTSAAPVAYLSEPQLYLLVVLKKVYLSVVYGNELTSPFSYVSYGVLMCAVKGNVELGYEFGQLALKLLSRQQNSELKGKTLLLVCIYTKHWKMHLRDTLNSLKIAYSSCLDVGDLAFAGYSAHNYGLYSYFAGENLNQLESEMAGYCEALKHLKQTVTLTYSQLVRQILLNLIGDAETTNVTILSGVAYNEQHQLSLQAAAGDRTGLALLWINKLVVSSLFSNFEEAIKQAREARQYLDAVLGFFYVPIFYFYESLTYLAVLKTRSDLEQQQMSDTITTNQEKLKDWATYGPMNFQHKFDLVAAERCRVCGNKIEATEYYDRAIAGAKENGYLQEEALANELAAQFYLNWGKIRIAREYMTEAYYGYARWGAKAKVTDLETRYPELLAPIFQQPHSSLSVKETIAASTANTSKSSSTSISDALDLGSILKASHTLSSEIELDKLLSTLLQVAIENAGANKAVLILSAEKGLMVKAVAYINFCPILQIPHPVKDSQELPTSLVQTVQHSLTPAVIIDARIHSQFATDPYIQQHQPKSILCSPILHQGKLLGMVYLENNLTIGAFTRDRVKILNLLCAQAAISLENARLYQQSQTYAQKLEQSLKKLQVSEARFQKLADNLPGVIYQYHIGADGTNSVLYVSSGCSELYEVTPEEFMTGKRDFHSMEHPDDRLGIRQAVMKSIETNTPMEHEWRIITPSGRVKWVQVVSRQEQQPDGSFLADGLILDVTARKSIEAEQTRLLAIMESTSDLIGTSDPTGKILYLNRAWRKLMNIDDAAVGEIKISQCHPDWVLEIIQNQAFPTAIHSGIWEGETAVLDCVGREIPVSQVVLAHKSSHGELEYFSTIVRDISDRKAVEAALQISEKNLRTIFDNSNNAIFIHKLDATLLDVNNRMLEMYRIQNKEQAIEFSVWDYSAPDNSFELMQNLWAKALTGESIRFEWKAKRPGDGSVFEVEIVLNKITLNGTEVILANIQDISERKQAELGLQQKSEALAQALQDLQQAQLQIVQSEKMSALGNLVSGIGHEMNNPLGFISGSLEQVQPSIVDLIEHLKLYQESPPNSIERIKNHATEIELDYSLEDLPKLINSMKIACNRLISISTSLRTFSRADQEYKVPFNIHEGIDSTLLILKHRLKANEKRPTIEVITNYGNIPEIDCFPGQLNQVFMNIIANAIDALDESSTGRSFAEIKMNPQRITITTSVVENESIKIAICDNGHGMNEEVKAKIFDHLFTTKGVGKGTGLGLAIAKSIIVEKHGGTITVNSILGKGTEFIISLPT